MVKKRGEKKSKWVVVIAIIALIVAVVALILILAEKNVINLSPIMYGGLKKVVALDCKDFEPHSPLDDPAGNYYPFLSKCVVSADGTQEKCDVCTDAYTLKEYYCSSAGAVTYRSNIPCTYGCVNGQCAS